MPDVATECYAMVRGSAIRVTGLGKNGQVPTPAPYTTSKCVAKVTINEVTEAAANEMLKNPEEERRIRFHRATQTIRHTVDINFLRVDPGVLSLVSGVPLIRKVPRGFGFGEAGFGTDPFGEEPDVVITGEGFGLEGFGFGGDAFGEFAFGGSGSDVIGFESGTRNPSAAFGLEVWSKLAGNPCADGQQNWGYTLFPYLRGGRLSGFQFSNGLVSFNLVGAQTRRASRWGVGPHDLEGTYERLIDPVSRNLSFRTFMGPLTPPAEACGIQETYDVLDNGTAANPMPDPDALVAVDGGGAVTSAYIIDGGRAV